MIEQGYNNLTYLDISESAAKKSKIFLGEQSKNIEWIVEDVLNFEPKQNFDVWHDRAVFHFLTEQNQIKKLFKNPVTLDEMKLQKSFKNWELLRIMRLSFMPVPENIWKIILKLSEK